MKPIKVIHRKLGREKADGQAWKENRVIEIDERITGKRYLETIIHEVFHVQNPRMSETRVAKQSKELANILFDLGFRWVDL